MTYIATGNGITAVIKGVPYTVTSDNPTYGLILDAIKAHAAEDVVADLFQTANAIKKYSNGNFEIVNDSTILYKGEEVHNIVVDRVLQFMTEGLPVEPLLAFLERLLANPSRRSITELYTFLEHESMPITPEGKFIAYKGVTNEYMDVHTGKFDNRVGAIHRMPRSKVDDDFRIGCSAGFHVGSLKYATGWGPKTVLVEVDPADVVSVPSDCECQKLRTCAYRVIAEYDGPLNRPLHTSEDPYGALDADELDTYEAW